MALLRLYQYILPDLPKNYIHVPAVTYYFQHQKSLGSRRRCAWTQIWNESSVFARQENQPRRREFFGILLLAANNLKVYRTTPRFTQTKDASLHIANHDRPRRRPNNGRRIAVATS